MSALLMLLMAGTVYGSDSGVKILKDNEWVYGTTANHDRVFNYSFTTPSEGNVSLELEVTSNYYSLPDGTKSSSPEPCLEFYYQFPGWYYIDWAYYNKSKKHTTFLLPKGTKLEIAVYNAANDPNSKIPYRVRAVFTPKDGSKVTPAPTPKPTLVPSKTTLPATGYYFIQSKNGSNMVLDINNLSLKDRSEGNLEIYYMNGGTNQIFYVSKGTDGYYRIKALHSNKYIYKTLYDYRSSNVFQGSLDCVKKYHNKKTDAVKWKIRSAGNGWCTIENKACDSMFKAGNRGFLENKNGSTSAGNNVITNMPRDRDSQKWKFIKTSKPGFTFDYSNTEYPQGTCMCTGKIRVSGDITANYPVKKMELRIYRKQNSKNVLVTKASKTPNNYRFSFEHEFALKSLTPGKYFFRIHCFNVYGNEDYTQGFFFDVAKEAHTTSLSGMYHFYSAVGSNKVMDVDNGGKTDATNVLLYSYHGANNQVFRLQKYGSDGWYYIIDANSNKPIQAAAQKASANVYIKTMKTGTAAQLWRFQDAGGGYYKIQNKNGFYLDVSGANPADCTNIQVYPQNNTAAQRWKLVRTGLASTLKISGQTEPGTIRKGEGFNIHGTISSNYKITSVTVGIYRTNGAVYSEKTVKPNTYSYDVSRLDYDIYVPNEAGTFVYRVKASDEHKFNVVLQESQFVITDSSSVTYAPYTGVNYRNLTSNSRRIAALQKAQNMVQIQWTAPCDFVTWQSSKGGYNPAVSVDRTAAYRFVKGKVYTGIPYSMAGRDWDDVAFANALKANRVTTDSMKTYWEGRPATTAHGVDCSKFIYYALSAANTGVSISPYLTTYTIKTSPGIFIRLSSFSQMQPGDIINVDNSSEQHVRMFVGRSGSQYAFFESTAGDSRCVYKLYYESELSAYTPYTFAGY